ncbi:Bacterial membrane flanked domain protein [Amycolatopsis sp. YIM 10]|nr:Bacterial membrane flanked domain protein [Amycolatopsis sp. YIM 10]
MPAADEDRPGEPPWLRLDRRVVASTAVVSTGAAIGFGYAGWASLSMPIGWLLLGALGVVLLGAAATEGYWRASRYRITADRLEQRVDFVVHRHRSLARERIRGVDVTANPLHRLLGLAVVTIHTGKQAGADRIKLDPLSKVAAARLRAELRRVAGRAQPVAPERNTAEYPRSGVLARLEWSWLRYAPTSPLAPLAVAAAGGAAVNVAGWLGVREQAVDWVIGLLSGQALVLTVLLFTVSAVVVAVLGSFAVFAVWWWDYELDREPGGTLRVRRGLLTTRSSTIEERRLRGVKVAEPAGNRLAGAARVDAVMTGRGEHEEDDRLALNTLLPAAPRAVATRVAAGVLGIDVTGAALTPHPAAARRRRIVRAVVGSLLPVAVLVPFGVRHAEIPLHAAWITALVLLPASVLLARDAYRNLGHGTSGGYLITRYGTGGRRTVALERDGVIGWTARQSFFQRRAGLITLTMITAAGSGAYSVFDADESEGLRFAGQALPELVVPFLETDSADGDAR